MVVWGTQSRDFWNGSVAMSTGYGPLRCTPLWYLENMAEESYYADVVVVPKFDMQCHESLMTAKDVKLLAMKYNVPLDLHPCAPTEGWTMDKLPKDAIGLYEQFFEFSRLELFDQVMNITVVVGPILDVISFKLELPLQILPDISRTDNSFLYRFDMLLQRPCLPWKYLQSFALRLSS
ncbi:hypothetical protein Tco_0937166 [Tanacetum coccineum]|uniref:Uncharacterized protein n=1 Tax=Tanacetum coccineum TaxID=301880 RepID=A0ABQ5DDH3_9ASTR